MSPAKHDTIDESWLRERTAHLAGAALVEKPEWEALTCTVGGKIFALRGEDGQGRPILSLKGSPEENVALRAVCSAIVPGYYLNKSHWNSVLLDDLDQVSTGLLDELFAESYRLVFASLTRRAQREISE